MRRATGHELAQEFRQRVALRSLREGGDPDVGLARADAFLERHPFYAQALIMKAHMFLAKGQGRPALRCSNVAKEIDAWKVYGFDEAEARYALGRLDQAVETLTAQIESLMEEIQSGTKLFLASTLVSRASQARIEREIRKQIVGLVAGRSERLATRAIATLLERSARDESSAARREFGRRSRDRPPTGSARSRPDRLPRAP
jgi:hypothetical protein